MTSSAYFPVTTHLFEMKGPDARDFLHRLTTADVKNMEIGEFKPGFFLAASGKIRAAFRLACRGEEAFYLEVDSGSEATGEDFLRLIEELKFSEQFQCSEMSGLTNAWILGLPSATENRLEERLQDGKTLILLHGDRHSLGTGWTSVWGSVSDVEHYSLTESTRRLVETEFERIRIRALFPRGTHELGAEVNPLEIGMRSGVADNKGCYPGQEVIEKIVSLGSPAKRLAFLSGSGPRPAPGAVVHSESGTEVGTITSSCSEVAGGFSALALLRKNVASEGRKLKISAGSAGTEVNVEKVAEYG